MKTKLFLIFLFTVSSLFSQTRLDSLVLVELNAYRSSLKLEPVSFSKDCFVISENHSTELVKTKNVLKHSDNFIGAEVVQVNYNFTIPIDDKDPELVLAKEIIKGWKNSTEHNRIMTSSKYKFAGVSTKMVSEVRKGSKFDKSIKKFKTVYIYSYFSTMNFK